MPIKPRTLIVLSWLAAAAGAVEFLFRAVLRANKLDLSDLAFPYVSTRLWLAGANPYDPSLFYPVWKAAGGVQGNLFFPVSVYPPIAFVPMVPFALLSWPWAVHLFLLCGLAFYAAAVLAMLRFGWPQLARPRDLSQHPAALFFLAFALGFAPIHSAFNAQNLVLISACAAILALVRILRAPRALAALPAWTAGAAVALSICLKPTTGFFLLPWLVRERRWRLVAGIAAACAIVAAIALIPLFAHNGTAWIPIYRSNVDRLFTHSGNADVSAANSVNTDRIDLQLVFFALLGDRSLSTAAAMAIYAALLLPFLYRAGWIGDRSLDAAAMEARQTRLLVASGSLALGMLPVYSRMYSGGILLPLVLWCLLNFKLSSARWLLLLLGDFLVNSSVILRRFLDSTTLSPGHRRLWDATIGGHTCWLLLALGVLLVRAMYQQSREPGTAAA